MAAERAPLAPVTHADEERAGRRQRESRRNVVLLAVCQALFMTCTSLIVSTAALVGLALAPSPALATLPQGLMFLVVMASTLPASLAMRRVGRRAGLMAGAGAGAAGGAIAFAGVTLGSFVLFCAGLCLLGLFNSFSQYFRFAAADAAPDGHKARAISTVLAGGVVAAFTGPNLARLTADALPAAPFAGGYATVCITALACVLVLSRIRIPAPSSAERAVGGRPMLAIAASPVFLVAVAGATVAYGSMNLVMTSTPLAMQVHGHSFGATAGVIQWHVFAMFAPSFFTGRLIQRVGVVQVMIAGAALLVACVAVSVAGTGHLHFWASLVLLGVGWNLLFVGGTTLLTEAYAPEEKARAQGVNDLLVFSVVALTASFSGALHESLGWLRLNLAVLPAVVAVLAACVWLALRRRRGA